MSGATGSTGPYGELITTTLRVLTWNAWGRFGPWEARETALIRTLEALQPDVIALQECWLDRGGGTQAARLAKALGFRRPRPTSGVGPPSSGASPARGGTCPSSRSPSTGRPTPARHGKLR
jgi:hypothetical protein